MPEDYETADKQHQTPDARPTTPFSYQAPSDKADNGSNHHNDSCREWVRLFVEFLALLFLIWYADSASIQATQAAKANSLSTKNAQAALRAYVNLGDATGALVKSTRLKPDGTAEIALNFNNSGVTPATHFEAAFLDGSGYLRFRERWFDKTSNGVMGWGLGSPDRIIPAHSSIDQKLIYHSKLQSGSLVVGLFEYCDSFGTYRCDAFMLRPILQPVLQFEATGGGMPCVPINYRLHPEGEILAGKKADWHPLFRCEQPKEITPDQGGKAEN